MYCKKCGKFIYSDDDYCSDCAPVATPTPEPVVTPTPIVKPEPVVIPQPVAEPVYTPAEPAKPKREGRVMDGFGPALTSVILSIFAYAFAYVGFIYIFMGEIGDAFGAEFLAAPTFAAAIVMLAFATGFAIPSLILGIKSIKFFRAAVANNRVKPIPALVMGIYGTVMSGSSFLMIFGSLMIALASLV